MAALAAPRKISKVPGISTGFLQKVPVATNAIIYHGAMVSKLAGYAKAAASGDDKVIGVADLSVWDDQDRTGQSSVQSRTTGNVIDNTGGADAARHVTVDTGIFKFLNKGGDLVVETMIGDLCYVENDQTVRATAAGGVAAGVVRGIEDDGGVLVLIANAA